MSGNPARLRLAYPRGITIAVLPSQAARPDVTSCQGLALGSHLIDIRPYRQ